MSMYTITVGNVGTVYSGYNRAEADRYFVHYRRESQYPRGRASGEPVTLFKDGEPVREYNPPQGELPHA